MLSILIRPPARVKDLMRKVRIERAGDTCDMSRLTINKLHQTSDIFHCSRNEQGSPLVAKICLHVDDQQVIPLLVFQGRRQVSLGRISRYGGHIRIEESPHSIGIVETG